MRNLLRCRQYETVFCLHHVEQIAPIVCWDYQHADQADIPAQKTKYFPDSRLDTQFDMLVHYEEYSQVASAIAREKEIKGWRREKKLKLILADNPDWADLSAEWEEDPSWKAISEEELRPMLKNPLLNLNGSRADSSPVPTSQNLSTDAYFMGWDSE